MKPRSIIIAAVVILVLVSSFLFGHSGSREKTALEKTRAELHQQGFKVDLSEFDFSAPSSLDAGITFNNRFIGRFSLRNGIEDRFMPKVGRDSALVLWKQDDPPAISRQRTWAALRSAMDKEGADFDIISQAVLSGPLRFNLYATAGSGLLLPHLAPISQAGQMFTARALLELHDGNTDAAWTNFLVATRLVTAWNTEPIEVSQQVKMSCAADAFDTTWQMLQAHDWSDDRLAVLQQEWENADFFSRLPETVAYDRARNVTMYESARQQPVTYAGGGAPQFINNPRNAGQNFAYYWRQLSYSKHGSYTDEKNMLLAYRDYEVQVSNAIKSPTWAAMRNLPAATNTVVYQPRNAAFAQAQARGMMSVWMTMTPYRGTGAGLLARAAEAEARRRVLLTAIALERYHGKHGAYPQSLAALTPEFLKKPLPDFMVGTPLRYHTTEDGHFILYSIGLDCVDHGGELAMRSGALPPARYTGSQAGGYRLRASPGQAPRIVTTVSPVATPAPPIMSSAPGNIPPADIVWPRPATDAEIQAPQ